MNSDTSSFLDILKVKANRAIRYGKKNWPKISGEYNWRLMRDRGDPDWYAAYLLTSHWRKTRDMVMSRDHFECSMCGSKEYLHVHHKTYENLGGELMEDLVTVCRNCHKLIHGKKRT